jgi:transposase-like protein
LEEGWSLVAAAQAAGVSERTARKWLRRFEHEGEAGLADHSSAAGPVANKTPDHTIEAIAALRRLRFTGAQTAELLDIALSTVSPSSRRSGWASFGGWTRGSHPNAPNVGIPASSSTSTSSGPGRIHSRSARHRATGNPVARVPVAPDTERPWRAGPTGQCRRMRPMS